MRTYRYFKLDTLKSFDEAERFKARLENRGFKVTTKTCGLDGVHIKGATQ